MTIIHLAMAMIMISLGLSFWHRATPSIMYDAKWRAIETLAMGFCLTLHGLLRFFMFMTDSAGHWIHLSADLALIVYSVMRYYRIMHIRSRTWFDPIL